MTILSESFSNALQPWMYAQLESKPKKNKNIVIIFQIMSAVYIVLGLGISLFFNEVMLVFGKNYSEVISIIPALIWGGVTSAISSLFVFVLFYFQDKAKYVAISTVIGAVANFGLCFLLIPSFGLAGCAYSLSISKLIMCLIRCIASAKTIECGYSVIIWTQAMALLTLLVSTFLINSGFLVRLAAFFALTLVLILIVFKSIKSFIEILKDKSYTEQ